MPFTAPHLLWKEDYIKRENELKEYMKYVPPSKEHEEVWSLELANQLLLIGSSIDSFFKRAIRELLDSFFKNFQIGHHQSSNYSLFLGMRQLSERLEKSETKKSFEPMFRGGFLLRYKMSSSIHITAVSEYASIFEKSGLIQFLIFGINATYLF